MIRFILLDIEGTTTDIRFVHQVLFPYSAQRLADFVNTHAETSEVQASLQSVKETIQTELGQSLDDAGAVNTLLNWIQTDRKHAALKQLQGMIWEAGFVSGDYQGHVYADVPVALARWQQQGLGLGIYSSGSVQAQKLLFGHSVAGDLTPYFSHYFDTRVGGKKEADSYRRIVQELQLPPSDVLFLSDVEAELDAAAEAGLQVLQLVRDEQTTPSQRHPFAADFTVIALPENAPLA